MRTLLSQFCEEFEQAVRPLVAPIERTTELLRETPDHPAARAAAPRLLDVQHELDVLADKVAGQQAYVLIFGPLKSGKSTLMNAMAAAYVSEVTSLPAYPCMVYVSHAEAREFELTRYNGEKTVLQDPAALRLAVERAHLDLAEHIRATEALGLEFDPAEHYPEAIRRIDVRVPAGELAQSGSVLVDTPGLYSRMRFGYDRMTREFRNAAACAIFVVKTDNLFLEQVFDEFHSLLELFSRIFLVVNLDGTKQDLRPDGTLGPSLESQDPIRVVQAFENLAMSAPLKAAAEEGRLRLYPVDLLRAASRRLAGAEGARSESTLPRATEADFDLFLGDLTDYLNSTDYLVAFLGDSLRRAHTLLREADEILMRPAVREIEGEANRLEQEQARCQARIEALDRLAAFDWRGALQPLEDQLMRIAESRAVAVSGRVAQAMTTEIDQWFQGDGSLHTLLHDRIRPRLSTCQRELSLAVHEVLAGQVAEGGAAVALPEEAAKDLVTAGIRLSELGREALDRVDPTGIVKVEMPPLSIDELPVKKTLLDWLLFRSKARVRRRLFGPPEKPVLRIPSEVKARRLGAHAKEMMRRTLERYHEQVFPEILAGLGRRIFEDYAHAVVRLLGERIDAVRAECAGEFAEFSERLRAERRLLNRFHDLGVAVASTRAEIEELEGRYQKTDPGLLIQPVPAPEGSHQSRVPNPDAPLVVEGKAAGPPRGANPASPEQEEAAELDRGKSRSAEA